MQEVRANRQPLVAPGAIDHHVADLTATFSADVTLGAAQEKLRAEGQWLPIDGDPNLSLGRLVGFNSTGPLRLGYGAWRDLLLGAQFTNGMGELITAGGRAVKNVAGYDLTKFMVGQGGVFGQLVAVTTRTYKRPTGAVIADFQPEMALVNRVMATDLRPQWMVLKPDALLLGYVGDDRAVDFYQQKLAEIAPRRIERRTIEQDIEHRQQLWRAEGETTYRVAVPPGKVRDLVERAKLKNWVADAAFGIVLGSTDAGSITALRDAARQLSGSVTIFGGDEIEYEPANDGQRHLLERLKKSFDPENRLKPLPWQKKA
ncbi:MAG TPA: FAD-binding oxidoreductase [Tepidisphaeraceae bacterium]|jgi:FAD/FMN-containing dehydrogenase